MMLPSFRPCCNIRLLESKFSMHLLLKKVFVQTFKSHYDTSLVKFDLFVVFQIHVKCLIQ